MEGHADGCTLRHGVAVSGEDARERRAVGAGRLGVNDVLRVLQAHAEEDLAVAQRQWRPAVAAGAARTADEGLDLELEHARGPHLWWRGREGERVD